MTKLTPITTGAHLIRRLDDHNPWWKGTDAFHPEGACPIDHHTDLRSDFYPFVANLAKDRLVVISGPSMVGKTTLLYDLIAACTDRDFRNRHLPPDENSETDASNGEDDAEAEEDAKTDEEWKTHRELLADIAGDLETAHPGQFLYVPLFDDPVHQIQAHEQLEAAIDHFEQEIRPPERSNFVLLLDDVQALYRSSDERWPETVRRVLEAGWRVVLTTTSPRRTWNTLRDHVEKAIEAGHLDGRAHFDEWVEPMMPWKFRDFVESRHAELRSHAGDDRFSSSSVRNAFYDSVTGDEPDPGVFAEELEENAEHLPDVDWDTEVLMYTFLGGTLGVRLAGDPEFPLEDTSDLFRSLVDRRERFDRRRADVLEQYREKLHRQAANSDINLGDLEDPERLLGLVAYLLSDEGTDAPSPVEGIQFEDLTDTFEVDRRTLRHKYFTLLDQFYILTASEEYDNQRPKDVRLYPRDFGLLHAFTNCSFDEFRNSPELRCAIAKVAAFDHTVRLTYSKNDDRDPKRGRVKFWPDDDGGTIDFVPRFDGRPVPVVFADVERGDDLDLTDPPVTTFDAFFAASHDSEQDPIADHHATALTGENLVDRREEYVASDEYAGSLGKESRSNAPIATDGEAPFGILLTRGSDEPLDKQVKVRQDFARKKVVELPLWLYLLSA